MTDNSDEPLEPELGYHSPYEPSNPVEPVEAEVVTDLDSPSQSPNQNPLSISGYISWMVVLALTLGITSLVATTQFLAEEEIGGDASSMDLMQIQLQGKFVVGQQELAKAAPGAPPTQLPAELNAGCYEQRICYSIILNEVESSSEALDYLEDLDAKVDEHGLELTDDQTRMRKVVNELLGNYESGNPDSTALPESDRTFLQDKLGWLGKLSLYPSNSPHKAERSAVIGAASKLTIGGVIAMLLIFLGGLAGFFISFGFFALLFSGNLKSKFANQATDHNIYIETFAIWLFCFFGASLLMPLLGIENPTIQMLLQPAIFFGSLLALFWPVVRGVSFAQVKHDIGWTFTNPLKEIGCAAVAYLALLPWLIPGLILIVVIMMLVGLGGQAHEFARQSTPGHPIQEDIMSGNVVTICFVFLATCVAAPIVEETMFRGVLFRHLRDLTVAWKQWTSVAFSAIANGLIFAAIHPQGLIAIPILTSLAIGFTLTRQWRGSLLASMTMHAIHNFLVTCVSVVIL